MESKPGQGAIDDGEVDIDAGFDQLGADHPDRHRVLSCSQCLPPCHQGLLDVGNGVAAVLGAHQAGQMPQAGAFFGLDPRIKFARISAAANNGEYCIVSGDLWRQLFPTARRFQVSRQMDLDPFQRTVQPGHVIDDFTDFAGCEAAQLAGLIEAVAAFQRRLGGGAQHQRDAVILDQQAQHVDHWLQIGHRQQLRLVKHDDAADQVVQLAATRGPAGEQTFEQLHVGRDDQRRVPVFAGQTGAGSFLLVVHLDIAMVFDDVFVAEDTAEDAGRLLDDAGVGDGVDNPAFAVTHRMA